MKENLTSLTGIAMVVAILIVAGCTSSKIPPPDRSMDVVHIYLKDASTDEKHHLQMYDSNDKAKKVVDSLMTNVKGGSEVYWVLTEDSGLKKIKKVYPKDTKGKIMPGPATGIFVFTGYKKHIVPESADPGEEKYIIKVKDDKGDRWEIDPHLKIPPAQQSLVPSQ